MQFLSSRELEERKNGWISMHENDLPVAREILEGWEIVKSGRAQYGDKFWRPVDRTWMPVVASDAKFGCDVHAAGMPVIIRKGD